MTTIAYMQVEFTRLGAGEIKNIKLKVYNKAWNILNKFLSNINNAL